MIRRNIGLRPDQVKWIDDNYIDISRMVRDLIDQVIEDGVQSIKEG